MAYLWRHALVRVDIHDTLGKESVYLVDKNPEQLTEQLLKVSTDKQAAIVADILRWDPRSSFFQKLKNISWWCEKTMEAMGLSGLLVGFKSGKYNLNMVKKHFMKEISYNKERECNEDAFDAKKVNDFM